VSLTFPGAALQDVGVFLCGSHEEPEVTVGYSKPVGIMGQGGPNIRTWVHLVDGIGDFMMKMLAVLKLLGAQYFIALLFL